VAVVSESTKQEGVVCLTYGGNEVDAVCIRYLLCGSAKRPAGHPISGIADMPAGD
jgi:hypothetical protein